MGDLAGSRAERTAEDHVDVRASRHRHGRAVGHGRVGPDEGHRQHRHVAGDAQGCCARLEVGHRPGARAGALGEQQQRDALVQQDAGHAATSAHALALDGERVEEQRRRQGLVPGVEEVVGRGARGEVLRQPARQRAVDQRGVEVAGVVGDNHERGLEAVEVPHPVGMHREGRPDVRLHDEVLRDQACGCRRSSGIPVRPRLSHPIVSFVRPPL